ncbi:aminotransferase-like domain-containing protein [Mesorhizobium xinjiangense]|uniref:aminotransferase-like domain-containing protein n=1 Tax=Mesorhizobium xinjiangense TaxID=2678685 RepID=UPI0012EE2848|nr:PLP-dependent aminotransferase family protein [Mesorhizobium xinjiangense]
MTNWLPSLPHGSGPLYLRLADQIESDIVSGILPVGSKLPPQRNLAFDIGVTIGTVGRAYKLVRERGFVSGEVGRGTYVLGQEEAATAPALPAPLTGTRSPPVPGKLRMDSTAAPDVGQSAVIENLTSSIAARSREECLDYVRTPSPGWLEAGCRWLDCGGWTPDPSAIVPTLGAHAAIMAVIAAVTAPGDRIVFENLTFSSIARSATLIGRRPIAVESDQSGVVPEDFDRLCAQQHPKIVFLMPCLQNPMLTNLSASRMADIVEIARKHNVWLIEDAVYGALLPEGPQSLAALAPERTFHIGGLSKTVAAGIRAGWIACPPHFAPRVFMTYKMLSGGKPFLMPELAAQLVLSGAAADILAKVRAEIAAREAMARASFAGLDFVSAAHAPFVWLKLPDPWLSGIFKHAVANEDVLIDDEDEFKPGRTEHVYHRVRIAFSALRTREEVQGGFDTVRRVLEGGAASYDSYG